MTTKPALPEAEHAFDPGKLTELEEAIKKLNPDEAAFFLFKLEQSLRKRKIQLTGYLVAIGVWLVAMLFALAFYGMSTGFVGWVFLLPFALVGVTLWAFGKWADKIGKAAPPGQAGMPNASPELTGKR